MEFELGRPKRPADPNKVLLVSVLNQLFPIDCDVAYRAFSQFGTVIRVAIFNRVTVQVSLAFFSPLPFSRLFPILSVHLMLSQVVRDPEAGGVRQRGASPQQSLQELLRPAGRVLHEGEGGRHGRLGLLQGAKTKIMMRTMLKQLSRRRCR